ncbi:hypothetical protein H6F93_00565 [Leptolyngbya sp. FACHB-671]|uniref:hypothetical protein n=1 Tax=Leptolyngbya sp. FACHB-671 TaxID=2692812 RepID=UPI0016882622|nr:hypothetical protein [Leptolyngbya sp. FACHB-671]MBD2066043.1 hypothetical protein [Leptolyngbya sp. FACHB-671]
MGNLARFNPSVSVIDAEIVAESCLQRVPSKYREQLRQPIIYLAQQREDGSIEQLVRAAINRQDVRLYQWVQKLQPEMEALCRRQDALENRVERLERRPTYHPAADAEPPSNFQLLCLIISMAIVGAMLVASSVERDISPHQPERIRIEREGQR